MKPGDLVMKRWGRIDPHQQNTAGVIVKEELIDAPTYPALSGSWILVMYPGHRPTKYRPSEFEVISENR